MTEAAPRKRAAIEPATALFESEDPVPVDARRPAALKGGTVLVLLRAVTSVVWWIGFVRAWPETIADAGLDRIPELSEFSAALLGVLLGIGALWTLFLLLLARWLWRGNNAARVLTMIWMTVSITSAAIGYFAAGAEITVRTTLLTLSLDILILLALSSRPARVWARAARAARVGKRER